MPKLYLVALMIFTLFYFCKPEWDETLFQASAELVDQQQVA